MKMLYPPAIIAALLVCYLLSMGPAAWLVDRGVIGIRVFTTAYAPVIPIIRHLPPAREPFFRYCEFCTGVVYSDAVCEVLPQGPFETQ